MVNDYETFLKLAKRIFHIAKEDEMFDMNNKKLVKSDFPHGIFLAMKEGDKYVGVKIMVGTQEQVKEAFKSG